jgi:hypothetical protein
MKPRLIKCPLNGDRFKEWYCREVCSCKQKCPAPSVGAIYKRQTGVGSAKNVAGLAGR